MKNMKIELPQNIALKHNWLCWLQYQAELMRYTNKQNMSVIGISEKELKEFMEEYHKEIVIEEQAPISDDFYTPFLIVVPHGQYKRIAAVVGGGVGPQSLDGIGIDFGDVDSVPVAADDNIAVVQLQSAGVSPFSIQRVGWGEAVQVGMGAIVLPRSILLLGWKQSP